MRALARAFLFLASAVWLAASSAAQTANSVNVLFNFGDFQQNPANVSQVRFTPIPTNGAVNGLLLHQEFPNFTRATAPSLTNGTLTISNVLKGVVYETTFTARGRDQTYYINADTNAADGATIGAWTNVVAPTNLFGLFLSYMPKVPGATIGQVWTATDANGNGSWQDSQGSGGGISVNTASNVVNGSIGVIGTNGAARGTTFQFSTSGTNVIQAIGDARYDPVNSASAVSAAMNSQFQASNVVYNARYDFLGYGTNAATAATNGFVAIADARYDPLNSALAVSTALQAFTNSVATSAFGNASGLSLGTVAMARLSTNVVTSTNQPWTPGQALVVVGTNTSGQPTIKGTNWPSGGSGGSGNVTGSGSTAVGEVPTFNATDATGIQGGGVLLANVTTNTGNLSGMMKGNGARGVTAATAGSDYVAPTATLTISGTSLQITSSAGAQDLSANRTWTLSFPNAMTLPGTLNVTGDQTNQGNLSVAGMGTNFGGFYAKSSVVISGGQTNLALTASTLLQADANKKLSSIANSAGALTNDASGNFGYVPLLDASALTTNQFVTTGPFTNLQSTLNAKAFGLTNLDGYFTNYFAATNIVLPADGNKWTVLLTNGPHLFLSFGGDNLGDTSIWITTNGDTQWPAQVTMLGYSNHLTTNCILDFKRWGGTNRVLGGQSEL